MEITEIKRSDNQIEVRRLKGIEDINFIDPECLWVDVQIEDRQGLKDIVLKMGFNHELYDRLLSPGETFRLQQFNEAYLLDLHLFNPKGLDTSNYMTLVFRGDVIYSFGDVPLTEFTYFMNMLSKRSNRKQNSNDLMAYFFGHMIDNDLRIVRSLRSKIDHFSEKVFIGFDNKDADTISRFKNQVEQYLTVIEDQFLAIGLLPDLSRVQEQAETKITLSRIASHLEHLQRIMERAEDKLDFLLQQYQSDVQELTNRRINILTIVQAIFVPLTFIAGIYGMNFVHMPELEWSKGYFIALVLMGFIACAELLVFWRKGWFD
jgi:magnesium transporter